jgi:hypothetical protein
MAILAENVAALRKFFGMPDTLELLPAVASMNELMGIAGQGPLPAQVDALVAQTGVSVTGAGDIAPRAAAATAPAAAAPARHRFLGSEEDFPRTVS